MYFLQTHETMKVPDNLPLHVHDCHGVCPTADDQIFRIFRQKMNTVDVHASARGRSSQRLEGVETFRRFRVPDFDGPVGRRADHVVAVDCVDCVVDVGGVTAKFFQSFARFETVTSNGGVEGRAQDLQIVLDVISYFCFE